MTNLLQPAASFTSATAAAIAAASLSDKQTHAFIAAICPAVFHRVDTEWQSHNITTVCSKGKPDYRAPSAYAIDRGNTREDLKEARIEIMFAAIAMQNEIDEANEEPDSIDDDAFNNWTPELDASEAIATAKATAYGARDADYIAYTTLFVMGVAAGLVVACITASAVLSNLPQ